MYFRINGICVIFLFWVSGLGARPKPFMEVMDYLNLRAGTIHGHYLELKGKAKAPGAEGYGILQQEIYTQTSPGVKSLLLESGERFQAFLQLKEAYLSSRGSEALYRATALALTDLQVLQDGIYFEIDVQWKALPFPQSPCYEFLIQTCRLLDQGQHLLIAWQQESPKAFLEGQRQFMTALDQWQKKRLELEKQGSWGSFPGSTQELMTLGESLENFLALSQENYGRQRKPSNLEEFYNEGLLPFFNDGTGGCIPAYNRLNEAMGQYFPPLLLRLPWMKPPPPQGQGLPRHFVILLDASGSMGKEGRWEALQAYLPSWLESPREESRFSLMQWSDSCTWLSYQEEHPFPSSSLIGRLSPGGEIRGKEAFDRIYADSPLRGYEVQLVFITDGGFRIDPALLQEVEDGAYHGQYLNIAYMGGEKRKRPLRQLALLGGGRLFDLGGESGRTSFVNFLRE